MRWNNLFDDLESQLDHELSADDLDVRAEEERLRIGRLSLRERLLALHETAGAAEYSIRIDVGGVLSRVQPLSMGRDWIAGILIDETIRHTQVVVPFPAITSIIVDRAQVRASLIETPKETSQSLTARLGLAFVLRDLCRRRCELDLQLPNGKVHGTIDRVSRDHLDIAIHEIGTPRRETLVSHYRIIPLDQVLMVRL